MKITYERNLKTSSKVYTWDSRYLNLALEVATWSKDSSSKIGAVIVDSDYRIVSLGYNGFAEGVKDLEKRWLRPEKYEWVVHAEQNAIINARGRDVRNCTLYVTTHPCHRCLQHIINAGIRRLVWIEPTEDFKKRWVEGENSRIFEETLKDVHQTLKTLEYKISSSS